MKKIIFLLFSFMISLTIVNANTIDKIDMDIYLDEEGNALITEVWSVNGSDGTEWYKGFKNVGKMTLSDFTVSMDGKPLQRKKWNVDESLKDKKGYYGINYTGDGFELCFGKYDYKKHTFVLNYKLSNFIFNTEDSQILYVTLIDELSNVNFKNFNVNVKSFYDFPLNLDVWGYGYKGYAYVENGNIKMSNEGKMKKSYATLLVKFPLNTFKTNIKYRQFNTFDDVYNQAQQDTYRYDYGQSNNSNFIDGFFKYAFYIGIFLLFASSFNSFNYKNYGYLNNKEINKKNTPLFRDIPCNKDIFYANALISLNNNNHKSENILGAILLKWIKENKITVKKEKNIKLILGLEFPHDNENENKLYAQIYAASNDGILEDYELKRWAANNYDNFFKLFNKITNDEITKLKTEGHIRKRKNSKECIFKNVMDDKIYNDYKELYGLKLFLQEFSSIKTKEAIEVHMWDEYLMFAYLFGIADKVAKQFKNMYPEIQTYDNYIDYDILDFINDISFSTAYAASSARSAAQAYSSTGSGGGGFSIGGGGGGSFGGGGGGSR